MQELVEDQHQENPKQMPTMFVEVDSIDAYIGKARQLEEGSQE